jgi:hypothetical protein
MAIDIFPGVNALLIPKHRYLGFCLIGSASGTALVAQTRKRAIELKFKYKTAYLVTSQQIFPINRVFCPIPLQKREKSRFLFPQVFFVPPALAQNYSKFESG